MTFSLLYLVNLRIRKIQNKKYINELDQPKLHDCATVN